MVKTSSCPSRQTIQELASGKLPPDSSEAILHHVETCAECLQTVREFASFDTLQDALRHTDTHDEPAETGVVQALIERFTDMAPSAVHETEDSSPAVAADPLAMLAPARGPQEIGWLGHYRVLKVLGTGGMGVVLEAEDMQLKRRVALKMMKPAQAADAKSRQRFLREAQAAAGLDHDHIVHIYQVGEDRGYPYLAMQFLEGMSLEQRLKTDAKPSLPETVRIGTQIALGLAAAHQRGLIHRDIKPANLWLETRSQGSGGRSQESETPKPRDERSESRGSTRVKILDFGLARTAETTEHITHSGTIVGTPAYMAPEQARGLPVDHRADLFSLGCVLYEMTTGQRPFHGPTTMSILSSLALDTPTAPQLVNFEVPEALSDLIMKLLEKEPAQRPATAQAVVDALATIGRQLGAKTSAAPIPTEELRAPKNVESAVPAVTGQPRGMFLPLVDQKGLALTADGHYRGTPDRIERDIRYVAQLADGSQVTLTPAEFAKRFGWKNDPERVKLK